MQGDKKFKLLGFTMGNAIIEVEVHLINPMEIPMLWEKVFPHLEKCARSSVEYDSAADFYHSLVTGFSGLFVAIKGKELLGVIIIQRMEFPHINICHIKALGGIRIQEWIDEANSAVYNWAATNDCQLVKAEGRPGWRKFYKDQGWKMNRVIYTIPVDQNLH